MQFEQMELLPPLAALVMLLAVVGFSRRAAKPAMFWTYTVAIAIIVGAAAWYLVWSGQVIFEWAAVGACLFIAIGAAVSVALEGQVSSSDSSLADWEHDV